ncbi:unnamed protein product [Gemmataceae bacterium]|nr:unnamed protein product [Gemmataceae bacterium]VTU00490.1 unnamed protein product [Gemmataceae bacterium]
MTEPHQFTLEALMAEEGLYVNAGLPENLRRQLAAAKEREEQAGALRERADRILASIAEHEAQIAKLHQELRQVLDQYVPSANAKGKVSAA